MDRVKVNENTGGNGGGIYSGGPLTMNDSEVSWNTSSNLGGGYGGGIVPRRARSPAHLTRVTVRYNTAEEYSGGIHAQGGGTLNLTNVTLTGNSSNQGAAATVTAGSTANFLNSTISGNTADRSQRQR